MLRNNAQRIAVSEGLLCTDLSTCSDDDYECENQQGECHDYDGDVEDEDDDETLNEPVSVLRHILGQRMVKIWPFSF